jgi:hypothetical protein
MNINNHLEWFMNIRNINKLEYDLSHYQYQNNVSKFHDIYLSVWHIYYFYCGISMIIPPHFWRLRRFPRVFHTGQPWLGGLGWG